MDSTKSPGPDGDPMARQGRDPPMVDMDDRGLRWRPLPGGLRIERQPSWYTSLFYGALLVGVLVLYWFMLPELAWPLASIMILGLLFITVFLAVRLIDNYHIDVAAAGLEWEHRAPRHFVGRWRRQIDGVRLTIGPEPVSFREHQKFHIHLRCNDTWTDFAFGHRKKIAQCLADDLAMAIGSTRETIRKDKD